MILIDSSILLIMEVDHFYDNRHRRSNWFDVDSLESLGIFRILLCGFTILYIYKLYGWRTATDYHHLSQVIWSPRSIHILFDFKTIPKQYIEVLSNYLWVPLLLSLLGVFTRLTMAVSALAMFFYFSVFINIYKQMVVDAPLVISFVTLAFTNCGARFSLDSFFRKEESKPKASPCGSLWFSFIRTYVVMVYFLAAIVKLKVSGIDWLVSDNLSTILLSLNQEWGRFLALEFSFVLKFIPAAIVALELAWIIVLFRSSAVKYVLPLTLIMHFSFFMCLGILFRGFLFLHLVFLPWKRIVPWINQRLKAFPFLARKDFRESEQVSLAFGKKMAYFTMLFVFIVLHVLEISGDVRKPFNWPFASYSMFAFSPLDANGHFRRTELLAVDRSGDIKPIEFCLSKPLTPKHMRELVARLVMLNRIDELTNLALLLWRKNGAGCEEYRDTTAFEIRKRIWFTPLPKSFDLRNSDEERLLHRINLGASFVNVNTSNDKVSD